MVQAYRVNSLSKVDKTLYREGDIFLTKRSVGILSNGKIENVAKNPDLSDYVKKSEVEQMIKEATKDE